MRNFLQQILAWARNKLWWPRAILLAWLGFVFTQNIMDHQFALNRIANIFNAFDLGIHELGHILFIPFGTFMTILGGSLFQCLFPAIWFGICIWKRWYFAACFCLCWVGFNLFDVAAYAADATTRNLPLVSLDVGADPDQAHDWYQILTRLGHLNWDLTIANYLRIAGSICIVLGLTMGLALVVYMVRRADTEEPV
ncbi:MAG TPA: hypothetical protein VLH86_05085 [Patescibacteria group bacterium]|nr:hypothetical protein [Patescibacteria group bacterium]